MSLRKILVAQVGLSALVCLSGCPPAEPGITLHAFVDPTVTEEQTIVLAMDVVSFNPTKIVLYDNDIMVEEFTSRPYNYAWTVTAADQGEHVWTAHAQYSVDGTRSASLMVSNALVFDVAIDPPGGDPPGGTDPRPTVGIPTWGKIISGDYAGSDPSPTNPGGWVQGWGVAASSRGDTYMTGTAWAYRVDLGDGILTDALRTFAAAYDPDGNFKWTHQLPIGSAGADVRVDSMDNVYVQGSKLSADGEVIFTGDWRNHFVLDETRQQIISVYTYAKSWGDGTTRKHEEIVITSHSMQDGALTWRKEFGKQFSHDRNPVAAVDSSGNIIVAFIGLGGFTVDGVSLDLEVENSSSFIVKFDSAGEAIWGRKAPQHVAAIVADQTSGNDRIYIGDTVLSSSGTELMQFEPLDAESNAVYGLAVDAFGNILATGTARISNDDLCQTYVALYDHQTGNRIWYLQNSANSEKCLFGVQKTMQGSSVATDGFNRVYAAGIFNGYALGVPTGDTSQLAFFASQYPLYSGWSAYLLRIE